jgi:hypothetical protein
MLAPYLLVLALLGGRHHATGDFSKLDCDKLCARPAAGCEKNCTRKPNPRARAECQKLCKDARDMCDDKCKEAQQKMKTLPKRSSQEE